MANALTVNPIFVDTTASAAVTGPKRVLGIVWCESEATNKDIAADDDFAVTDTAGVVIIEKRAAAVGDGIVLMFPHSMPFTGLIVTKLDGGVCYIYLE